MKKATSKILTGDDAEMMSDGTLKRLLEYLKQEGWSDTQIVKMLEYITSK